MAKQIYRYLLKNDYTDNNDAVTDTYHDARKDGTLAELPPELAPFVMADLKVPTMHRCEIVLSSSLDFFPRHNF